MEFTLTINATPEFIGAINSLSAALGSKIEKTANTSNNTQVTQITGQTQQPVTQVYTQPPVQQQVQIQQQSQPQNTIPIVNQGTQPVQTPQQVQPSVQQMQQPATVIPTAEQTYTQDQLAVAATQLMDAGRRNDLMGLLTSFGVQALTMLPKEQYGPFATQLRAMGAKI